MVASDKIQDAKEYFQEMKESGRNNYQKYNYAELKDIVPIVNRVCKEFKLKTKFDWDYVNNVMTLTVTDREDGSVDVSVIPLAVLSGGDPGKWMQDVGRIQTYARRYLYLQCFDIAVPDEIDGVDQKGGGVPKRKTAPKKTVKKSTLPVQPVKEETNKGEVTAERIKNILNSAEKEFEEAQLKKKEEERLDFTWENVKDIIRGYCRSDREYSICKQSTVFKTADKIE